MNLFSKLTARAEAGRPIRVGMIGAGKFGSMFLAQVLKLPGIHIVGVVDLSPDAARSNMSYVGWTPERFAATSLDDAVRTGRTGEASAADTVIETGEACHVEFDAICDTVGGEIAAAYYSNLKSGGVFCSVSTNSLPPPTRDDIVVRNFVCYPDVQKLAELAVAAASGFDLTGPLETLPLSAASAAHTRLEAGERKKFALVLRN